MPCTHNSMVTNDSPTHAWKCADCGYVYGTDNNRTSFSEKPTVKSKWILFEGVTEKNMFQRFFTTYDRSDKNDPTKGYTGETWYKVLGYTDTIAAAQIYLFGRATTKSKD